LKSDNFLQFISLQKVIFEKLYYKQEKQQTTQIQKMHWAMAAMSWFA